MGAAAERRARRARSWARTLLAVARAAALPAAHSGVGRRAGASVVGPPPGYSPRVPCVPATCLSLLLGGLSSPSHVILVCHAGGSLTRTVMASNMKKNKGIIKTSKETRTNKENNKRKTRQIKQN